VSTISSSCPPSPSSPSGPSRTVVVGQGYVGLPLALRAVDVGHDVVGVDLDQRRVAALAAGTSFVGDVSDARLRRALDTGRYRPTADYADAREFDVAVITVPTPLRDSLPDLRYVESAARSLARLLRRGATVILESTTSPGTTAEVLVPLLEAGSGLRAGVDFSVGYSPERIDPGNADWTFETTPKLVSGIDAASLRRVSSFYEQLVEQVVPVSGTREAELAKLLENTFRHVNIALVNELAVAARELGIDAHEAIDAASTKPFGFMKFTPGPGVGGHCLPVDPTYLSWEVRRKTGRPFRFVELANEINEGMPAQVVERAEALLNDFSRAVRGAKILLVGLAYKPDSADARESPALRVAELLRTKGAHVLAVDPYVDDRDWPVGVERVDSARAAAECDLAVVLTPHSTVDLAPLAGLPVLDTRGVMPAQQAVRL